MISNDLLYLIVAWIFSVVGYIGLTAVCIVFIIGVGIAIFSPKEDKINAVFALLMVIGGTPGMLLWVAMGRLFFEHIGG